MLYYIKQHISKLVIADYYEETFEGQSNQPEKLMSFKNSGDTSIQIRVEVKRLFFAWIFEFLTAISIIPTNKMCLNVF